MNIADLLEKAPNPGRAALVFAGQNPEGVTFAELDGLSARWALRLQGMGLQTADRALLLAPISIHVYALLIGLFRIGATAVFLDPQASAAELLHAARSAGAKVLVGSPVLLALGRLVPALSSIRLFVNPESFLRDGREGRSISQGITDLESDAAALITMTGGTTGREGPRAVIRTHGLLLAQHTAIGRAFPVDHSDVDMPGFPIVSLHNLAAGITSVIPQNAFRHPERLSPTRTLTQMRAHGVTTASGSPAYWRPIARYCARSGEQLRLRRILVGGAPVGPRLIRDLTRAAPGAEIISVYGSTEAEPIATISAGEILSETASLTARGHGIPLGKPVQGIDVRFLPSSGMGGGPGSPMEICVAGAHVSSGYLDPAHGPGDERHLELDGRTWYRTGDIGYADEKGRLWIVGRVGNEMRRGGLTIYPIPVEAMIEEMPFVRRAGLVGVGDPGKEQRLQLSLELEPEETLPQGWRAEVLDTCSRNGTPIDELRVVRHMPVDRRHSARIDRRRLLAGNARA